MNQLIILLGLLVGLPVLLTALLTRGGQPTLRKAEVASNESRKPHRRNPNAKSW